MPHLHIQLTGHHKIPGGQVVPIPPALALLQRGPCVQVTVKVSQPIAEQLLQRGELLPTPISGIALIDTGASSTAIDLEAAATLGIPAVDTIPIASATHEAMTMPIYPISVEITGLPFTFDAPRATGAPLAKQGLLLLIGRDLLQHCTLFYNGLVGQITLAI